MFPCGAKLLKTNNLQELKKPHGNKGRKRPPFSKEWLQKMSDTHKKIGTKPPSCLGRKFTDEMRKKWSEVKRGSRNPGWKGGIHREDLKLKHTIEYRQWRDSVYKRDNWTCQKCKSGGPNLNGHHIFNFSSNPDLRLEVKNGITLCFDCHYEFHGIYGRKNNNREQIDEYLKQELVLV